MSTEVRRVPLDFDWPLEKQWDGYLSPFHFPQCAACDGTGLSPEAYAIDHTFYPHQISRTDRELSEKLAWGDKIGQAEVDNLIAEGRLSVFDREKGHYVKPSEAGVKLTAAMVNEANGREKSPMGMLAHDAINRWILVRFRCNQLGIELNCSTCRGHADIATDEQRAEAEAWERTDPPAGEGWQLWEDVSEGSPVTPVFATSEELVDHLVNVGFWQKPMRREAAEALVRQGSSFGSFITHNEGGRVELLDATRDADKLERSAKT